MKQRRKQQNHRQPTRKAAPRSREEWSDVFSRTEWYAIIIGAVIVALIVSGKNGMIYQAQFNELGSTQIQTAPAIYYTH